MVVRELLGVMTSQKAKGGFVVASVDLLKMQESRLGVLGMFAIPEMPGDDFHILILED